MEKLVWLVDFTLDCGATAYSGALRSCTSKRPALLYRRTRYWPLVFVLAATATTFSGWTLLDTRAIYNVGLPYAFASFYAITIPSSGVLFLKRQPVIWQTIWLYNAREMFSDYYRSDAMRMLTVVVALVFSVPYLGIQLKASGLLFNRLLAGTPTNIWPLRR